MNRKSRLSIAPASHRNRTPARAARHAGWIPSDFQEASCKCLPHPVQGILGKPRAKMSGPPVLRPMTSRDQNGSGKASGAMLVNRPGLDDVRLLPLCFAGLRPHARCYRQRGPVVGKARPTPTQANLRREMRGTNCNRSRPGAGAESLQPCLRVRRLRQRGACGKCGSDAPELR